MAAEIPPMSGGTLTSARVTPIIGAGLVILRGDKVLLARRLSEPGRGTFGCCGGKLNIGESIESCLRREAREEFGIRVGQFKFLAVSNIVLGDSHFVDLTFNARIIGRERPRVREPHKMDSLGWYPLLELPQPLFLPVHYALFGSAPERFREIRSATLQLELFPRIAEREPVAPRTPQHHVLDGSEQFELWSHV